MERQRKQYTAAFKVQVLRKHLENQVPIGKLADQHGI
ncbi:MAG: transposase [Bacteroidetes bacterium]|nr:transposase [Bacteroidota bacterium]MBU1678127.1 transposase [Bacteroidota bacterium]MBU2507758.1 transposase [Bacteroidota bacterium]